MKYPEYKPIVSLIPGGCPQFLDFGLDTRDLRRDYRSFREEKREQSQESRYSHYLRCLDEAEDDGGLIDMLEARGTCDAKSLSHPRRYDEDYSVRLDDALECFRGEWMPIPFLRVTGQYWPDGSPMVERGPSNWARGMFLPDGEGSDTWHLAVVFDTRIEPRPDNGEHKYFALSQEDLNAASEFIIAWHVRDNAWFVNENWIDSWVLERHDRWMQSKRRYAAGGEEEFRLRHLAHYMAWLDCVRRAIGDVRVKVSDSDRSDAIDVDLVLDIGNSRTTGILVETSSAKKTNLNDSYLLELRDLTDINRTYSDPFETRVEFYDVSFGSDQLSRRSGRRTPAFAWPSCVRIGPEATRLSTYANCAEGNTGMSSPKRYLWDESKWNQSWRYNTCGRAEPMVTRGLFPRQLNECGTPLFCFEGRDKSRYLTTSALRSQQADPLFGSYFTRSSLMMFMAGEIIAQALVNINSPANRSKRQLSDKPRHLRRIIFTVPTAMPVAERRIFQRWVELAVRLVWNGFGWSTETERSFLWQAMPKVTCEWDEASCSHLVLLYNEIMVKHRGDASHYFSLFGKERENRHGKMLPSVRIASIDIGGGTTDLSITTHFMTSAASESPRIEPRMEFRDGFNIAGDEVLKEVVRSIVVPAIEKGVEACGLEPKGVVFSLFGRYTQAKTEDMRTRQGQFVRQVAVPVALGILDCCEALDGDDGRMLSCRIGDFFTGRELPKDDWEAVGAVVQPDFQAPAPQRGVIDFLKGILGEECTASLMAMPVTFSLPAVNEIIRRSLGNPLSSLCEMVRAYDTDVLLVTGRPSAWHGVIQTILAKPPLTPDRLVAMHAYHVGNWYPCADVNGHITDPKSTVVVGAILCALSCGYLEGINFDPTSMRPSSTARYVGELNQQGQLEQDKVWFTVGDDGTVEPEEKEIIYHSPITVGYRQLAVDRWPASRYYKIDIADKTLGNGSYAIRLRLNKEDVQSGRDDEAPVGEGEISVLEVSRIEADGGRMPLRQSAATANTQTLASSEGYWLDTGIVIN